jgi:RND family efflux transporter MFP subunit
LQGYTRISAPFAGVITRELVKAGDLATPGAPLFTIEGTDQLQVEVQVPESFALPASDGALTVRIDDTEVVGTLAEISPSADGSSRTRSAKIDLPADVPARSGQFVRVLWPVGETQALWAPPEAVTRFGQMERVFVIQDDRARLRLVRTGARHDTGIAILAGLNDGDTVVLDPPAGLRDGQPVEVIQ